MNLCVALIEPSINEEKVDLVMVHNKLVPQEANSLKQKGHGFFSKFLFVLLHNLIVCKQKR